MIWPKCACVILVSLLLLQHVSCRYSLKEICSQRCLYGRGGILCHCNAMHFTGKRSGGSHAHHSSIESGGKGDNLQTSDSIDGDLTSDEDTAIGVAGDGSFIFNNSPAPSSHYTNRIQYGGGDRRGPADPFKLLSAICAYGCKDGKGKNSLCRCSSSPSHSTKTSSGYNHNSIDSRTHHKNNVKSNGGSGDASVEDGGFRGSRSPSRQMAGHASGRLPPYNHGLNQGDIDTLLLQYSVDNQLQYSTGPKTRDNSNSLSSSSSSLLSSSPFSSLAFTSLSPSSMKSSLPSSYLDFDLPQEFQTRTFDEDGDMNADDVTSHDGKYGDLLKKNDRYPQQTHNAHGESGESRDRGHQRRSVVDAYWTIEMCASLCNKGMGGHGVCDCPGNTHHHRDIHHGPRYADALDGLRRSMALPDDFLDNDESRNDAADDDDNGVDDGNNDDDDDDIEALLNTATNQDRSRGRGRGGNSDTTIPKMLGSQSESEAIHDLMGDMLTRLSTLHGHSGAHHRRQRHAIPPSDSHSDDKTETNNNNDDNNNNSNNEGVENNVQKEGKENAEEMKELTTTLSILDSENYNIDNDNDNSNNQSDKKSSDNNKS